MIEPAAITARDAVIDLLGSQFPAEIEISPKKVKRSQLEKDLKKVFPIKTAGQGGARFGYFQEGYSSHHFSRCACAMVFDQLSESSGLAHFDPNFGADTGYWNLMPQGIYTIFGVKFESTWDLGDAINTFKDKGLLNQVFISLEKTDIQWGYSVHFFPTLEKIYIENKGSKHVYMVDTFKVSILSNIPGIQNLKDHLLVDRDISHAFYM